MASNFCAFRFPGRYIVAMAWTMAGKYRGLLYRRAGLGQRETRCGTAVTSFTMSVK